MIVLQEGAIPEVEQHHPYAIVAITKHGVEIGRRLQQTFAQSDLYYMSKFEKGDEEQRHIQLFTGTVRLLLPALFKQYKGLIVIISLGAVVRMIAPILQDKKTDPGVVVIDDRGENVISVLSGHLGGANELTHEVAAALGANPIITTASDVQKTIPVDLFGSRFGWVWDSADKLTPVSASVVNEEHVAIVQETGERDWWMRDTPLPEQIKSYSSTQEAIAAKPHASIIVTDRLLCQEEEVLLENGVVYRPKSLVLGMGCNRGTSKEEIQAVIEETLLELELSIKSVKALCTIELKKDEKGFLDVVAENGWEFVYYNSDELNSVPIEIPSQTVFKYTGAYGVSEPAALLYSSAERLLMNKKKSGNTTISVARIPFE